MSRDGWHQPFFYGARSRVASTLPPEHYEEAVARAVERIRAGAFEKIVLGMLTAFGLGVLGAVLKAVLPLIHLSS